MGVGSDVVDIVEPAKEGYHLTLRLNFSKIPCGKGLVILHIISEIDVKIKLNLTPIK